MGFTLPDLPYPYDALEPHVDSSTLREHHQGHHRAHVDALNRALEHTPWADMPVEAPLARLDEITDGPITAYRRTRTRHHGGGHLHHTLLWTSLSPDGGGEPEGPLAAALADTFGGFDRFRDRVANEARRLYGSGWVWLVRAGGELRVTALPNEDSPVSLGQIPLLGLDCWEHAYHARHGHRRADWVAAWWHVVDWATIGRRYAAAGA